MDEDNREMPVKVLAVTENYMYHYAYMTPKLYTELFSEDPEYNMIIFDSASDDEDVERIIGEDLLANKSSS